jgi:hypothetical protein
MPDVNRLTFGIDRDPAAAAEWAHHPRHPIPLTLSGNPMVAAYRQGPAGRKCGECRFLFVKHDHGNRRYFGCEMRGKPAHGPATDHLSGWVACRLFEEATDA